MFENAAAAAHLFERKQRQITFAGARLGHMRQAAPTTAGRMRNHRLIAGIGARIPRQVIHISAKTLIDTVSAGEQNDHHHRSRRMRRGVILTGGSVSRSLIRLR